MMHCTMDDLLALRAGEGSAWARSHAAACATCRAELDALYQRVAQLKALPARRSARDRAAALAAALEDRIAVIDGELAQLGPAQAQGRPADLVTLWQQRVELMEQLVSVHVTRAAYVGL